MFAVDRHDGITRPDAATIVVAHASPRIAVGLERHGLRILVCCHDGTAALAAIRSLAPEFSRGLERVGIAAQEAVGTGCRVLYTLSDEGGIPILALQLSPREVEVLELVAQGRTDRTIGTCLYLSRETVRTVLTRCSEKLGVTGRTALATTAQHLGLID